MTIFNKPFKKVKLMQEIINEYLTIDQKYIKHCNIKNKNLLYDILKWWKKLSESETIGDLHKINGNTALIKINLGSNKYVINADSNKEGVAEFLNNKNNPWCLIENDNGIENKITNSETKSPIKGFYMYK